MDVRLQDDDKYSDDAAKRGASAMSGILGAVIEHASIADEKLILVMRGAGVLHIYDDGQSCCENRHMSTDDDVQTLVGNQLLAITEKGESTLKNESRDVHDAMFVEVQTSGGFVTLVNHNEHNGDYGGFSLVVKIVQPSLAGMILSKPSF